MGKFLTDLEVKLIDDAANNGQGEWETLAELVYETTEGTRYVVPVGFRTDFASVPRAPGAYLIAGCRGHRAAVLHDFLIRHTVIPRRKADDLFYEALLATKTPPTVAAMMHIAVRSYSDSLERPKGWEEEI